jgi:hypothetical protein
VLPIQAQWKRAWVAGAKIKESGIGLPSSDYSDERKTNKTNKQQSTEKKGKLTYSLN